MNTQIPTKVLKRLEAIKQRTELADAKRREQRVTHLLLDPLSVNYKTP